MLMRGKNKKMSSIERHNERKRQIEAKRKRTYLRIKAAMSETKQQHRSQNALVSNNNKRK